MTEQMPEYDPLEIAEKRPSVSFDPNNEDGHGHSMGEVTTLILQSYPKELDQRDPETREVETWDNGDHKKVIVIQVEEDGVDRTLWVKKSTKAGSMLSAINLAQRQAREKAGSKTLRLAPGGVLKLGWMSEDRSQAKKSKAHSWPKVYKASYTPPAEAPPADNPFDDEPATEATVKVESTRADADPWGGTSEADYSPFGDAPADKDEPDF